MLRINVFLFLSFFSSVFKTRPKTVNFSQTYVLSCKNFIYMFLKKVLNI